MSSQLAAILLLHAGNSLCTPALWAVMLTAVRLGHSPRDQFPAGVVVGAVERLTPTAECSVADRGEFRFRRCILRKCRSKNLCDLRILRGRLRFSAFSSP